MKIHEMIASKKEIELNLSAWTRKGGIERALTLSDESYDGGKSDYNYSLTINEISDLETAEKVNFSCQEMECLLPNTGLTYPHCGRLIGHARVMKVKFDNQKDMHYLWSNIYFQQSLYESIERSLLNYSKVWISLEGLKYDESDEKNGFQENEKSCIEERFIITNAFFRGIAENIITAAS